MTFRRDGDFAADGYTIIRGAVPLAVLAEVRESLREGLARIGEPIKSAPLDELLMQRERQNHDDVYQATNFVGSSVAAYRLVAAPGVTDVVEEVTGKRGLHVMPMTISVQFPSDERFDYKWHQEGSFYPWAPGVINAWIPFMRPTTRDGGTMYVLPGSHVGGLRGAESYFSHEKFRQIECGVPENEATGEVPMELELGDFVIFDANLVHRSHANYSRLSRMVCILRYIPMQSLSKVRPLYKALSYEE